MTDLASRAFIFDMDGTLVDNMDFHAKSWVSFFAEIGMEVEADDFLRKTAGKTSYEIFRGIFERRFQSGGRQKYLHRLF